MSKLSKKQKLKMLAVCRDVLLHTPTVEAHAHHNFKLWLKEQVRQGLTPDKLDMEKFYDTVSDSLLNYKCPCEPFVEALEIEIEKTNKRDPKPPPKK